MKNNDTLVGVEALIVFIAIIMIVALFTGFFLPDANQQIQARIVGSQADSLQTDQVQLLSVSGQVEDGELYAVEVALNVQDLDLLQNTNIQVVVDEQVYGYNFAGYVQDCGEAILTPNGFYVSELETVIDVVNGDRVELCFPAPVDVVLGSSIGVDVVPPLSGAVGVDVDVPQFAINDIVFMFPEDE